MKSFPLLISLNIPLTQYLIRTLLLETVKLLEKSLNYNLLNIRRYCGSEVSIVVIPSKITLLYYYILQNIC